ncbi:hypothetical protein DH2020_014574 [Rehmannia glutinosa]|uniref:SWIM-type domain-containing protein n=1 Tax=Rehmannia glutinosa TaxID=99300 RepID=A0ABR0X0A6_REHGL
MANASLTQQRNQIWPDDVHHRFDKMQRLGLQHIVQMYDYADQVASVITQVPGSQRSRTFKVKLSTQECSCGQWKNDGIPCSHAMQACRHFRVDPSVFMKQYYTTSAYLRTYSAGHFVPLPDDDEWDEPPFQTQHNPERRTVRRRGRDTTLRICNEMDRPQTRARQQYRASERAETSQR